MVYSIATEMQSRKNCTMHITSPWKQVGSVMFYDSARRNVKFPLTRPEP